MSVLRVFFKVFQLKNYFLKKFNTLIFDTLNIQFSIKIYYLESLKSTIRTLVNISLNIINLILKINILMVYRF